MPELHLRRSGSTLDVILGEHRSSLLLADVALNATTWEDIYDDAVAYGRDLFDKTFRDEQMSTMLATLSANERLLLVADDPLVAAVPWEYLRDQNNKLLASRLNFVRGIPDAKRRESFTFTGPLEIIAIPVSPVDEPRVLNVEREWKNLVEAVSTTTPPKSLTLKRVRPPTRSQLERNLGRQCTSIVHFMGHSTGHDGKAFLAFEDARACSHLVDSADFADSLNSRVFLVVLNSCLSAVVAPTQFGNIAHTLVQRGVPYALGMQFILPDDAALVLSDALYDFLLQGYSIEEAIMYARRALEEPGKLSNPHWLAGIPVLYTSLRTPAPTIELAPGQPIIQPDPEQLQQICDLTALTQAEHFLGRGDQISNVLDILLSPHQRGFVLLHGLGGIGKTSLARAIADRVSWHYGDRVLALSFETFAYLDANNQRVVDEMFADRFYNRLAHFYELDLKDSKLYPTTAALQQAILHRRAHVRSLLVLDNIETLIDTQRQDQPATQALAAFISRLKEGEGAILLTSRMIPPSDWGECQLIEILGLQDEAGADLFLALLPADYKHLAQPAARLALSHRIQGHPLSIRLLAGRFADETSIDLFTFLANIEAELEQAEQTTPFSLEDTDRQRTLYACMDYSTKRLTLKQKKVLDAVSIFHAPFPPEYAAYLLNDEEQNLIHLQNLVRLGLLTAFLYTFKEGNLILLELHTMLRWYIQQHRVERGSSLQERYGEVYEELTQQARQQEGGYDQSTLMSYLVRQSLPDCEVALQYLPLATRNTMAYHLAYPYVRLGQYQRALTLYEQALEGFQELGNNQGVGVTQHAMADVLVQQDKLQDALELYEQALHTARELGDSRGATGTQRDIADVLVQQGKLQDALELYEQSLHTTRELGDLLGVTAILYTITDVLVRQDKLQDALVYYEQCLNIWQELGDIRRIALIKAKFCQLLFRQGNHRRALSMAWESYTSLSRHGFSNDAQTLRQLLIAVKRQVLGSAQFDILWKQVINEPQPDWLLTVQTGSITISISAQTIQAVYAFVNAESWEATRQVIETQQALLFQPEVEILFEENIIQAKTTGNQLSVQLLEQHLAILRECKKNGITSTFEKLTTPHQDDPPFDAELIPRSITALLSSPQEKMAHVQYLAELNARATDEGLKSFLQTIQLALFGGDLSQLGQDLSGVYRQAWVTILAFVETGGVDPRLLEQLIHNTLTVLGPAAERRNEWRDQLIHIMAQAREGNAHELVALLDAIIRLLDAAGNPTGLGTGLISIYARTWQTIIEQIAL